MPIVPSILIAPMADDATTPPNGDPRPCPPCRGTGRVVSRLGGSASTVTCPWCEGTGHVIPGHDAQAARRGATTEPPDDAA
jgi:DnaJ-class molecular chaperone